MNVWLAFYAGLVIGCFVGILVMGLLVISREDRGKTKSQHTLRDIIKKIIADYNLTCAFGQEAGFRDRGPWLDVQAWWLYKGAPVYTAWGMYFEEDGEDG